MVKREHFLRRCINLIAIVMFCASCSNNPQVPKKHIEAPALSSNTKEFKKYTMRSKDPKKTMKAIAGVLQNNGFVLVNCSNDLGIITARKEIDIEKTGDRSFQELMDGPQGRWAKLRIIDSTVDILEDGSVVNLKATFQVKDLDNRGAPIGVDSIEDQAFYRDFFAKVETLALDSTKIPSLK